MGIPPLDKLLSVKEVAEILNLSPRTIYDNARRLGGFYPAGIRVLRFNPEVIRGIMEGKGRMEVQVSIPGEKISRRNLSDPCGGAGGSGRKEKKRACLPPTDPDRHNLPAGRKPLFRLVPAAAREENP